MNTKKYSIIIFFAILFISTFTNLKADKLEIIIKNINILKGNMKIAIYNKEEAFPKKNKEYKVFTVPVTNKTLIFKINNIPAGRYAIAVYQDINRDDKCNKNILGIPTEPFGFSNNVKVRFTAPDFRDCAFTLKGEKILTIILKYM